VTRSGFLENSFHQILGERLEVYFRNWSKGVLLSLCCVYNAGVKDSPAQIIIPEPIWIWQVLLILEVELQPQEWGQGQPPPHWGPHLTTSLVSSMRCSSTWDDLPWHPWPKSAYLCPHSLSA
jgi:hypothetical protein